MHLAQTPSVAHFRPTAWIYLIELREVHEAFLQQGLQPCRTLLLLCHNAYMQVQTDGRNSGARTQMDIT